MLKEKPKHIIYVDKGDKPSRFMVDLYEIKKAKEESGRKKRKNFSIFKKLKANSRKIPNTPKEEQIVYSEPSEKTTENFRLFKESQYFKKIKRLAIVPVFMLSFLGILKVFKLLFRLCYKIGWTAVFFVRVFYFTCLAVLKPIKTFFVFLTGSKKDVFLKAANTTRALTNFALFKDRADKVDVHVSSQPLESQDAEPEFFMEEADIEESEEHEKEITHVSDRAERAWVKGFFTFLKQPKYRPAIVFALILTILSLPLKGYSFYSEMNTMKGRVLGASESAIEEMINAGRSAVNMDIETASANFTQASNNFMLAQQEIENVDGMLAVLGAVVPNKTLKLASKAEAVFEAGRLSAEMGRELALAFEPLMTEEEKKLEDIINSFYEHGSNASALCKQLKALIDLVDAGDVPDEFSDQFRDLKERLSFLETNLTEFVDIVFQAKEFLGLNLDKRYLLVFQNNTELRASGGFIGSFALVDFRDGRITNLEVPGGGSYDTEAGLLDRVKAPEPLQLVNPLWHFWDANWWPDWGISARKLMWFYEKSNGPTVDGVISLTPTVIERFLKVIGPVDMSDDYGVIITAENFWHVTQTFAEQKSDVTNKPKKIIGDLFDKIIEELPKRLDKDNFIALAKQTEASLSEKHILMYFSDPGLEEKIAEYNWDGRVKDTDLDYLMVVNSNIAGGKSDRKIRETINHTAEVQMDGSVINTISIKREHTAGKNEPFAGVRNVDWMRIYVPKGSKLLSADGFERPAGNYFEDPDPEWADDPDVMRYEGQARSHSMSGTKVYEEENKTVFANWSMVDPGQTELITVKYLLPFKLAVPKDKSFLEKAEMMLNPAKKEIAVYTLLAQKQPGSIGSFFESTLILPENLVPIWAYPGESGLHKEGWSVKDRLKNDKYFATLLEIKK